VGQAEPNGGVVIQPVERLPAHHLPEQNRYVDKKDLFRLKIALRMVCSGLGVQTCVSVSKVVKSVLVGLLGLRDDRTVRAGLSRWTGLL
jgi:hypothetical protein